jgi:hypothetical protein
MTSTNANRRASDAAARKADHLGGTIASENIASQSQTQARSWRDVLLIHPACELLPLMSPDEFATLTEDIRKNGQLIPVTVWKCPHGTTMLLDGRHRLDALERIVGTPIVRRDGDALEWGAHHEHLPSDVDPVAYIISANVTRRHLTPKQKRDIIAKLLQADPTKSDRQIAEMVKASPTTVGKERAKLEAKGDVSKLDTRRDTKGRKQPAKKKRRTIEDFQADTRAKQARREETAHEEALLAAADEAGNLYLDDDGNFAPDDPEADAICRIRGFLYRAEQSALGAEIDLRNLVCTKEMIQAAKQAVDAWTTTYHELTAAADEAAS